MSAPPVIVAHGKERYYFHWNEKDLRKISLLDFKEICRENTGIPLNGMKIIFSGAILKDEHAMLAFYGIYPGCIIRLMGSKIEGADTGMSKEELEQQAIIEKLDELLHEAGDLVLQRIRDFILNVQIYIDQFYGKNNGEMMEYLETIKDAERKVLFDSYMIINELLMQKLLKVDSIECPPGVESIRAQRKKVVNQLQEWMDQTDKAKNTILNREKGIV